VSDITERLRREWWQVSDVDCKTAADEIERLRAEAAGLREFVEHVRRNGSTHLANMAVAVLAARKGEA
jgi:hypothetical protein